MGFLFELLKDLPVSSVLRERVLQYEADVLKLKEEKAELKEELADVKEKYLKLLREFEEYRALHEKFVEVKGMKFKRLDSGAYCETPYCVNPACHNVPMSLVDMLGGIAVCPHCKYNVKMTRSRLDEILRDLSGK